MNSTLLRNLSKKGGKSMKAVSVTPYAHRADGKRVVSVCIVADSTPATLPTTGAEVEGLTENDIFAPFSILYVVATDAETKVYLADESGHFVPQ